MARINAGEKQAVVEYYLTHSSDYTQTANRFGFTYQQVYGWVRKYHTAGLDSLRHGRNCSRELSDWITENQQLKKANLELEMEAVLHREIQQHRRQSCGAPDISGVRQAAVYQAVKDLNEKRRWPIYKLCPAAGISRSGYYKWLKRTVSQKQMDDEKLAGLIAGIY